MGRKNDQVTFDDIAAYTHFSKTTISRYFNKPDTLTEKNRQIIRQALVDLDYRENKVAQILARGTTGYIGVLIPSMYLHYFSEMLNQILKTRSYKFIVALGGETADIERTYIRELLSYQVEGLIVLTHRLSSAELAGLGIPVVGIEREDACISSVNCDNYMGAVQAASLLIEKDCDVLLHVNSPTKKELPAYQRITGFTDTCRERGIPYKVFIAQMENDGISTTRAMTQIFEEIEARYPTQKKGIFFSDDTRANAFLNVLLRRYKTLPPSYQLVGFDNSPIATESVYTLSTVGQQIDVIAKEAVSILLDQIQRRKEGDAQEEEPVHRVITPVLCRRETTEWEDAAVQEQSPAE